jgi:tetratricopeptide (TPR) repeat protein
LVVVVVLVVSVVVVVVIIVVSLLRLLSMAYHEWKRGIDAHKNYKELLHSEDKIKERCPQASYFTYKLDSDKETNETTYNHQEQSSDIEPADDKIEKKKTIKKEMDNKHNKHEEEVAEVTETKGKRFVLKTDEDAAEIDRLLKLIKFQFDDKGTEHPITLDNIDILATLYLKVNELKDAEYWLQRSWEGRKRISFITKNYLPTYKSQSLLALTKTAMRKFSEARIHFVECLPGLDSYLGPDHSDVLDTVEGYALVCVETQDYALAEMYYERALNFRQKRDGVDHPLALATITKLADVYVYQERFEDANTLCSKSLDDCIRLLGKVHPVTQAAVTILAKVRYVQGYQEEAEDMYTLALEIQIKTVGEYDSLTINTMCRIAELLERRHAYYEAELMRRKTLERCEVVYGDEAPITLTECHILGVLLFYEERLDEAEEKLRRAYKGRCEFIDPINPATLDSLHFLGKVLSIRSKWKHSLDNEAVSKECEEVFVRCINGRDIALGKQHENTVETMECFCSFLEDQFRLIDAEPYFRRLIDACEKKLGRNHAKTASMHYQLGAVLQLKAEFEESAVCFLNAHYIYAKVYEDSINSNDLDLIQECYDLYKACDHRASL